MSTADDSRKKDAVNEGENKPLHPLMTPPAGTAAPDPRRIRAAELAAKQNDSMSDGEGMFALIDGESVLANAQKTRELKAAEALSVKTEEKHGEQPGEKPKENPKEAVRETPKELLAVAPPPVAEKGNTEKTGTAQSREAPRGPIEQVARAHNFDVRTDSHMHNFLVSYYASAQFVDQVAQAVNQTPQNHLKALNRAGYHVVVARDIDTYDKIFGTKLSGVHPPGYPAGWTWNNVDVIFDDKNNRVLAFENFLNPRNYNKPDTLTNNVYLPGRLMHELGHAHDDLFCKKIQNDPKALEIYTHCLKELKLKDEEFKALNYFTQTGPDHPGLREAIAESYSIIHSTGSESPDDNKLFKTRFSQFIEYLKNAKY